MLKLPILISCPRNSIYQLIMKEFVCVLFLLLLKVLVYIAKDLPPNVYCHTESLNWEKAIEQCSNKGGVLLSFMTGLGKNIDELNLKSEVDIWTADYLTDSSGYQERFCGFKYYSGPGSFQTQEELFGDCNEIKNYFCKVSGGKLEIYNSTRGNVQCNGTVTSLDIMRSEDVIKPGLYWSLGTFDGKEVKGMTTNPKLCGAYKDSIGLYNINGLQTQKCFDRQETLSIKHTSSVNSMKDPGTSTREFYTITAEVISETTSGVRPFSQEDEIQMRKEMKSSDIGIKVGIPVGIILPLICGVFIMIYIYRKRCWKARNSKHENRFMKVFQTHDNSPVQGEPNAYSESTQDTSISQEQHTHYTNISNHLGVCAEYGDVKKSKKGNTKSTMENYSHKAYSNKAFDEYDVTGNFQISTDNPSNNVYNRLESDEYNTTSSTNRQEERSNIYNTTEDQNRVESAYDCTTQCRGTTALPDDIYNHLSQHENNYDSTTNIRNKR